MVFIWVWTATVCWPSVHEACREDTHTQPIIISVTVPGHDGKGLQHVYQHLQAVYRGQSWSFGNVMEATLSHYQCDSLENAAHCHYYVVR